MIANCFGCQREIPIVGCPGTVSICIASDSGPEQYFWNMNVCMKHLGDLAKMNILAEQGRDSNKFPEEAETTPECQTPDPLFTLTC